MAKLTWSVLQKSSVSIPLPLNEILFIVKVTDQDAHLACIQCYASYATFSTCSGFSFLPIFHMIKHLLVKMVVENVQNCGSSNSAVSCT